MKRLIYRILTWPFGQIEYWVNDWLRTDEKKWKQDLTHGTEARRINALWVEADLIRRAINKDLPIEPGPRQ